MYKVAKQVDKQLNNNEQTLTVKTLLRRSQCMTPLRHKYHVSGEESTSDSDSETEKIMDHTFDNLIMEL